MKATRSFRLAVVRNPLAGAISSLLLSGALVGAAQAQLFPPVIKLADLDGSTGFRIDGVATGDYSGFSVSSVGDINGDGIDDFIVGAPGVSDGDSQSVGSAYVVFGRDATASGGFPPALNLSSLDGSNGFRIDGVAPGDFAGWSVSAAGDINGDGVDDLIIGARQASPGGMHQAGSSYVVFGRDVSAVGSFPAAVKLAELDGNDGFRIDGAAENDRSGASVSWAGDINGDGVDDLIIGAPGAFPMVNLHVGSSFVVFGRDVSSKGSFPTSLSLADLDGSNGFRVNGLGLGDQSGFSVSGTGDINGDGIDDLIIGVPNTSPDGNGSAGSSFVIFGRNVAVDGDFTATIDPSSLDGSNGFRIDGAAASDYCGFSVSAAGDINHDGIADLIIGAPGPFFSNGSQAAHSYVVFGRDVSASGDFPASLKLSSLDGSNGFRIDGVVPGVYSGVSVSAAGDVNGDGIDDLIMGAPGAHPDGDSPTGSSYVIFGRNVSVDGAFPATLDLTSLTGYNGFRIDGVAADENSGYSVSTAGDVNGDGVDDLIIGSNRLDLSGGFGAGSSYVVFGRRDAIFADGFE